MVEAIFEQLHQACQELGAIVVGGHTEITYGIERIATFIAGERFAVKLPHAHLTDLRVPLEHGEVVLLVDVPFERVREIEHLVAERHPEIGVGGVGWTIEAFGV